ncbi:hypothetical protein MKW94_021317, partial [Papaver nudicaule]|nr:hypothetical protein [Papaver nudicaule]
MAYCHQSSLLGQLKVDDPKDIEKDMCLHTYVIELPGVKAESVKTRVSEGRFLIIEAQGCKEAVSPLEAELEKMARESQERIEKMRRETQEIKRKTQETKRKTQEIKRKTQERVEEMKRESQERVEQIRGSSSRESRNRGREEVPAG